MTAAYLYYQMLRSSFYLQAPSGELISYAEMLSAYEAYIVVNRSDLYVLIPKENLTTLNLTTLYERVIVANLHGVRIYNVRTYLLRLSNIHYKLSCKPQYLLSPCMTESIPPQIQNTICSQLIKNY